MTKDQLNEYQEEADSDEPIMEYSGGQYLRDCIGDLVAEVKRLQKELKAVKK
jgi:hypothetical protein